MQQSSTKAQRPKNLPIKKEDREIGNPKTEMAKRFSRSFQTDDAPSNTVKIKRIDETDERVSVIDNSWT